MELTRRQASLGPLETRINDFMRSQKDVPLVRGNPRNHRKSRKNTDRIGSRCIDNPYVRIVPPPNLHTHSSHSVRDSIERPDDLFATAASDGQSALAITDHGNLSGPTWPMGPLRLPYSWVIAAVRRFLLRDSRSTPRVLLEPSTCWVRVRVGRVSACCCG